MIACYYSIRSYCSAYFSCKLSLFYCTWTCTDKGNRNHPVGRRMRGNRPSGGRRVAYSESRKEKMKLHGNRWAAECAGTDRAAKRASPTANRAQAKKITRPAIYIIYHT